MIVKVDLYFEVTSQKKSLPAIPLLKERLRTRVLEEIPHSGYDFDLVENGVRTEVNCDLLSDSEILERIRTAK